MLNLRYSNNSRESRKNLRNSKKLGPSRSELPRLDCTIQSKVISSTNEAKNYRARTREPNTRPFLTNATKTLAIIRTLDVVLYLDSHSAVAATFKHYVLT